MSHREAAQGELTGNQKLGQKDDVTENNNSLLKRRGFLKTVSAGVVAAMGMAGTATAAEYEVITLSDGETWSHSLGDGETFENVLFDCTASNTRVSIKATSQNWTIRNVGIKGAHDQSGGHAVFALSAASGTDCLVENVYMGDGSTEYGGASGSETGVWIAPESSGRITFRHMNIQDWKDNGIYGSAPGKGGDGAVVIEKSYAANNNHADFRIGSSGSVVRDSVVKDGGDRGIWCWYNDDLKIENCQVQMSGSSKAAVHAGPYEPGGVRLYDTQYFGSLVDDGQGDGEITLVDGNGTSPQVDVPDGVPQTPEAAAKGSASTSGDDGGEGPLSRTLEVATPEGGDLVEYEIVTSGEIARADKAEDSDTLQENDDGTWTVTGVTGDGYTDTFTFEGEVQDYSISGGEATILVDGQPIDEDEEAPVSHTLEVATPEGGDLVEYEIVTSGEIARAEKAEDSDTLQENDDGTWTVTGVTGDGYTDTFTFDGEVQDYSISGGEATILVDGQPINEDEEAPVSHTLEVATPDGGDLVEYEIVTSGEIARGEKAEGSDTLQENDDGTWTVTGVTGDGYTDTFTFEGEVQDYSISGGEATISVDGQPINEAENKARTIRIETPSGGDRVQYAVTTEGELSRGEEAESTDSLQENDDGTWTVTGVTGDGHTDSFEFLGELREVTVVGDATVLVDGTQTDLLTFGPRPLRVETPSGGSLTKYQITTTGELSPGDRAEGSDSVTQNDDGTWTVSGVTGDGYGDSFEFSGAVVDYTFSTDEATLIAGDVEIDI